MIYEIDYVFCAVSAFIFKNFLTFALFIILSYLLLRYVISYLSNRTIILYLLFIITLFAGSIVLLLLPSKEDVLGNVVVNSYYLGPVAFVLYIALITSLIIDLVKLFINKKNNNKVKEDKKEPKKEKVKLQRKSVKKAVKEVKQKITKKTSKKNNKTK